MKPRDRIELLVLAALWGASFLFMRLAAPSFGPIPTVWLRVAVAAAMLLPLLVMRGEAGALRRHWKAIAIVGLTNSALPFACYAYALLSLTGSLAAVFNAATPLFGALIAWVWLGDRLSPPRALGLAIGFAGVFALAWDKASFKGDAQSLQTTLSVAACLLATLSYGWSASYTKRHLVGVPPMALAAGSQIAAALVWTLPAAFTWPSAMPDAAAWGAALLLGVGCTGLAYILYFRLIASAGPAHALTVTYLVPAFAVLWGVTLLGETATPAMLAACAVILVGTALATGLLPRTPRPVRG